jgi:hypothetical protein
LRRALDTLSTRAKPIARSRDGRPVRRALRHLPGQSAAPGLGRKRYDEYPVLILFRFSQDDLQEPE